ncbi:MAG: hypothetical protein KAJ78_00160 [Acidobacteria bacterium]|nr:hypothetical protein [Acidobacteriota bacterium]
MRKLGEILLEKGVTSIGELHTALEACHRHRSRLGTQLLRLNFVTEKQLLDALREQTGRPPVPREILEAATIDVMGLIPLETAQRLHAIPFAKLHRQLHVALINPRDDVAIEEIHAGTGLDVEPFVVTETTLEAALARLGEGESGVLDADGRLDNSHPAESDWEDSLNGVLPTVADLMVLPSQVDEEWDFGVAYATFPGLAPVVDPSVVTGPGFLDEVGLKKALCVAESRDGVGEALLSYAARFLTRLCLFSVYQDKVHGWLVEGMGPVLEDVQSFVIDLTLPSMLSTVAASGHPHEGPIPPGERNENIVACLGDPLAHDVLLVPVKVQDRTVAFLMGDIPGQSTIGAPVREIAGAANVTGMALEMIILRRKIGKVLGA